MKSNFDKYTFWEEMARIKSDYKIRISQKPSARAAKRITILITTAYLSCDGSVHWVQDLETAVYEAVKEKHLECDPLEMEYEDRSYICRNKKSPLHGRKIMATRFDNHMICTNAMGEAPKAKLFADILTEYLALEEVNDAKEFSGDHPRKRLDGTFRPGESRALPAQETGVTLRASYKKPSGLLGEKCPRMVGDQSRAENQLDFSKSVTENI